MNEFNIDKKILEQPMITRSFKVRQEVINEFHEVCNKFPHLKKQDLLTVALLEFINKYKELGD